MLFFCWYGASLEERTFRELQMMQEPRRKERLVGTSQGCHCGICQCVHLDPCSDQAFVHCDRCFSCLKILPFSLLLSLSRRHFAQSIPPWCVGQLVMLQLQHRAVLKRSFLRLIQKVFRLAWFHCTSWCTIKKYMEGCEGEHSAFVGKEHRNRGELYVSWGWCKSNEGRKQCRLEHRRGCFCDGWKA